jgi:hypothetical protein
LRPYSTRPEFDYARRTTLLPRERAYAPHPGAVLEILAKVVRAALN